MVTANNKWEMEPSACVVETLVTLLCFELGMHKLKWLSITHVPHEAVIHVAASVLDAGAFLALAARGKHWFELPKFFHGLF